MAYQYVRTPVVDIRLFSCTNARQNISVAGAVPQPKAAKPVSRRRPDTPAGQDELTPTADANTVPSADGGGTGTAGLDSLRRAGATDTPTWMIVAIPTVPRKGDAASLARLAWPAEAVPGAGLAAPDTPAAIEAAVRTLRRTPAAAPLLLSTLFSYRRRLFEQPPVPTGVSRAAARFGKSVPPAARAPDPDCGGGDSDTLECRPEAFDAALAARFHRRLTTGNRTAAAPGVGRSAAGTAPHRPSIRVAVMAMRLPHPSFEIARLLWGGEPWVEFHEAGRLRAEAGGQPSVSPPLIALAQSSVGHRTAIHPAAASSAASPAADLAKIPDPCDPRALHSGGDCRDHRGGVLPMTAAEDTEFRHGSVLRPNGVVRRQSLDVARLLMAVAGRSRWVMLSEDDFWMCQVAPLALQFAVMHAGSPAAPQAGRGPTALGVAASLRVSYGLNGLAFHNGLPPPGSRLAMDAALLTRGVLGNDWPAAEVASYAPLVCVSYLKWPRNRQPPLGPVELDPAVPPDAMGFAAYLVRHRTRRPPDHLSIEFVGRERNAADLHYRLDWPVLWSAPSREPEFSVGAAGGRRHTCAAVGPDVAGHDAGPDRAPCLRTARVPATLRYNLFRHDGARQSTLRDEEHGDPPACFSNITQLSLPEGFDFGRCGAFDYSPCTAPSAPVYYGSVPWEGWARETMVG